MTQLPRPLRTRIFLLLLVLAGTAYVIINANYSPRPQAATVTVPAGPVQVPAPATPPLTATAVSGPLGTVLADLRQADKHDREAWVADGYSVDLQTLINLTDSADGYDPLNVNARVFATDASAYLSQNGAGLQPGWQAEYATVRADLNRLAADTGSTPAGPGPADLSAKPDSTLPWQPPANAAGSAAPACTVKNTVTNSSSSTGAHSQSVKTATKCGTGTTATTSSRTVRTSVSKTGAVTVTVTNTSG